MEKVKKKNFCHNIINYIKFFQYIQCFHTIIIIVIFMDKILPKKKFHTSKHIIKKILVTYIQIWLITRYTICLIGLHHTDSIPAKYRIQNTKNKMYGIHICKTIIVDFDQSWFRLSPFRMCTRCFNVTNEFMLLVLSSCFIVFTSLQMYPE